VGKMSKNDEGAWRVEKPTDSFGQLNDAPLWSAWNFQHKRRDWHEDIYDELHSRTLLGAAKQPL
jgi:hypothetical protein